MVFQIWISCLLWHWDRNSKLWQPGIYPLFKENQRRDPQIGGYGRLGYDPCCWWSGWLYAGGLSLLQLRCHLDRYLQYADRLSKHFAAGANAQPRWAVRFFHPAGWLRHCPQLRKQGACLGISKVLYLRETTARNSGARGSDGLYRSVSCLGADQYPEFLSFLYLGM